MLCPLRSDGSEVIEADLKGVDKGHAIFVSKAGVVSANITMPEGAYQIRDDGAGGHVVRHINQGAFPPDEPSVPTPTILRSHTDASPAALALGDDRGTIDVLVLYTTATKNAAGGAASIESQVNLAVAETNQAYGNSGIAQRLRLAGVAEVDYAESGTLNIDLSRLTAKADGYLDGVHRLRDAYGADLVSLIVEDAGAYCGMAWHMANPSIDFAPYGFSVVARSCATGYYTFGHELGHNMGANHDIYVSQGTTPYSYAHGYVNVAGRWRTVLAYNNACQAQGVSCTRIQYFSNPALTYSGAALGDSQSDNQKTFDDTAIYVANFRQAR